MTATDPTEALEELRVQLPVLRELAGAPNGSDDDILAMSSAPGHTACPNPFVDGWLPDTTTRDDRVDPGPFAADTTAGKTSLVYKAHSYPTKVPHEAIMRLILHYTEPGDVVLDGFCGTGMTGVAAQMCGSPSSELRRQISTEMEDVRWGPRKAFLQDISPSATFIAAGLNLPVDPSEFDRLSAEVLARFERDWGWMYETTVHDGGRSVAAKIDYTVWSQVFTCSHCGGRVVYYDAAFDEKNLSFRDDIECPSCGAATTRKRLLDRHSRITTLGGDSIDRIEFQPVVLSWRSGKQTGRKQVDEADLAVLRSIHQHAIAWFPSQDLPYLHRVNKWAFPEKGFTRAHHFWSDRALASLAALWELCAQVGTSPAAQRALRFWVEQSFWGMSWMNRYRPDGFSQVSQYQSGVYYVPALHAEPSPRYNLEGTSPARGKRKGLVKLWEATSAFNETAVRIGTGSSTALPLPDASVDYVFIDPPFGENLYYSDLSYLTESWHRVWTSTPEEAIVDRNVTRPKSLMDYARLIEACFAEFHRVLKPGRWMTVEFSNSSNEVWLTIQQALAAAGFVVADTRVFDKSQYSFSQVVGVDTVKRDLIISAYKPASELAERVAVESGSEEGVRAFVAEHLTHLPVKHGRRGEGLPVRERMADRLYDRMVAFHVANGIAVPMTTAEFNTAVDRWFVLRDGMYFLPSQAEEWERHRLTFKELEQLDLFITGESSALQWLRQLLRSKARTYAEIQPPFFAEVQRGTVGWEELPDLRVMLEQNFVSDSNGRWTVPDPAKAEHLEQLRDAELLRVFESYKSGRGSLDRFRSEAVRVGFKKAWGERDFATIIAVGRRLPQEAFTDDPSLLHYFRNAERMAA